jgi:hypothetical protein
MFDTKIGNTLTLGRQGGLQRRHGLAQSGGGSGLGHVHAGASALLAVSGPLALKVSA